MGNQHVALSRWFEIVMQLVNPKVALPYWDYTIEGQLVNMTGNPMAFRTSMVFDKDMFGPCLNNGIVTEGRFGYTPAYKNAQNYSLVYNAYGYMRAPWNQNNLPYVTRFNTTYGVNFQAAPTCRTHRTVLEYTSFADYGKYIEYRPHGTTHMLIGGIGHADFMNQLLSMGYDMELARSWVPTAFGIQKDMFRAKIMECPQTCSVDTPVSECKCTCPELEWYLSMGEKELLHQHLRKWLDDVPGRAYNKTHDFVGYDVVKMLCNSFKPESAPVMGDSLESASPADVSFWPTHPTVERLTHWKRLNGFLNSTWPQNTSWSVMGYELGYCAGHELHDVLTWPNYIFKPTLAGPYSNFQVWNLTDPNQDYLTYVYDSFNWEHCAEAGLDLTLIPTDIETSFWI